MPQNYFVTGLTPVLTDPLTIVAVTRYFGSNGGAYAYRFSVGGNSGVDGIPGAGEAIRSNHGYKEVVGYNYTTSGTTLTIGTGAHTLVVADDLGWHAAPPPTMYMNLQADNDNCMIGTVTSFDPSTKTMVVNITTIDGSGTFSSWDVRGLYSNYSYTNYPNVTRWDTLINVYNGANSKSIVNGVDNGSGTMPTPMKHTGLKLTYCEYLEVITYNKALNTDEIAELGTYLTNKYTETDFQDRWSMYFDGVDEYITCGRVEDMEVETLTYSVWIKPAGYNRSTCILMKGSSSNRGIAFWILPSNVLVCQAGNFTNDSFYGSQVADLPTYIPLDTWGHIAFTHEQTGTGATQKIYINGILRNTYTSTTNPYTISYPGTNLYLGQRNNNTYHLIGNMDDVAVWDTALDADTITSIYNSGKPNDLTLAASYTAGSGVDKSGDLQGYWLMGDGATYNGGLGLPYTIPDAWAETLFSKNYFDFDGVDDYVNCGDSDELQITGNLTLSAWVKHSGAVSGNQFIAGKGHYAPQDGYSIYSRNPTGAGFAIYKSGVFTYITDSVTTIDDGEWHHIMGVNDGTDLTLYIDGVLKGTNSGGGGVIDGNSNNFTVGAYTTSQLFDGLIDDVAVFNSVKAIGDIWTGTGKPSDLSEETGLVGYWKFDDATFSTQWTVPDSRSLASLYSKNYFYFDGVDDVISARGAGYPWWSYLTGESACTVSVWIKASVGTNYMRFVEKNGVIGIFQNGLTNQIRYSLNTSSGYVQVSGNIGTLDNTWIHCAMIYDGTDFKVYENGSLLSTTAHTGTILGNAQYLYFGNYGSGGYALEGNLDDIAIFDTAKAIGDLWDGSGKPTDLSAESGLVGYWIFDDATISGQWTVPDHSSNSADGTSVAMSADNKKSYANNGTSNAMGPDNKKYYANEAKLTNGSLVNAKMDTP